MSNEILILTIIVFIAFLIGIFGGLHYAFIDDPLPVKKHKLS